MNRDAMTKIDTWKALLTLGLWMLASVPSTIAATEPATPPVEPEVLADALIVAEDQDPCDLEAARLEQVRELCAQRGDTRGEIDALLRLVVVYAAAEDEVNVVASARRVLPLLKAAEDHLGVWVVRMGLIEIARRRGDPATAEMHFREALLAIDRLEAGTPISIETMAIVSDQAGMPAGMLRMIAPVFELVRPVWLHSLKVQTRQSLASVLTAAGRHEEASSLLEEAFSEPFGLFDKEFLQEIERLRLAVPRKGWHEPAGFAPTSSPADQSEIATDRTEIGEDESSAQDTARAEADALLAGIGPLSGDADFGRAYDRIERALALYEKAGDPAGQGTCLLALAKICHQTEGHAAAMELYGRAWEVVEEEGNSFDHWLVQMAMGTNERGAGCYPEALEHLRLALESVRGAWRNNESIRFHLFSQLGHELGRSSRMEPDRAPIPELWEWILPPGWYVPPLDSLMVKMMRPFVINEFESETLAELSNTLVAMGRYDEAAAYLDQAQGFYNPNLDKARDHLRQLQEPNKPPRKLDEQELTLQEVLPNWLIADNLDADALLDQMPESSDLHDQYWRIVGGQDLSHWQKALEEARQENDPIREVRVLLDWGDENRLRDRPAEARALFEQALALARDIGRQDLEAETLEDLGMLHLIANRYEAALRDLEQAMAIQRRRGHKPDQARTLSKLGRAYIVLGSYEQGMRMVQEAQRLAQEVGDASLEKALEQWIAPLDRVPGGDDQRPTADQVVGGPGLALPSDFHSLLREFLSFSRLTDWPEHDGEDLDRVQQALALAEELSSPVLEMQPRIDPAGIEEWFQPYQCDGKLRTGLEELISALRAGQNWDEMQAMGLQMLGSITWAEGEGEDAIGFLRRGLEDFEEMQPQVRVEDLLASLIHDRWHALYETLIEMLAYEGNADDAFAYAERARARAFLRQTGNVRLDRSRVDDPALIAEAEELDRQLTDLERELASARQELVPPGNESRTETLRSELEQARADYEHMLLRLKLFDPEYASQAGVEPISADALRTEILDHETTLVAYRVNASRTLAWVIDRDALHMVPIDISREDLTARVRYLRNLIAERKPEAESVAGELHETLIAPLLSYVRHRNLIIVPHGVLHLLPFAALRDAERGSYLLADYTVTYTPSASLLRFVETKRTPNGGRALVVGDPDGSLPHAAAEAVRVARRLGQEPFLGQAATESRIYDDAGEIDFLHLAAHASYDAVDPHFSRIALAADDANDGNLELHEIIERLELREVNLVVLSACATALGVETRGDELVGMTRAFLHAGSPAVVTTFWPIDDEASAVLMDAFYRQLQHGATIAAALRAAQLEVMEQGGWRSPYYWAAFALSGEGRGRW